jgi:hypothetical protein
MDQGSKRMGSITLTFTDNGMDGYTLSRHGYDIDGDTNINDGFASSSGEAWMERNVMGDVAMQVVLTGKFVFVAYTFQGNWHSSTNFEGEYTSFCAKNPPANTITAQSAPDKVDIVVNGINYSFCVLHQGLQYISLVCIFLLSLSHVISLPSSFYLLCFTCNRRLIKSLAALQSHPLVHNVCHLLDSELHCEHNDQLQWEIQ